MCGIAGIVPRRSTDPETLHRIVKRMTDALVHRGPDDEGFYTTPDIALGMRRLSIIDVAGGQQPISNSSGRRSIVFNGEIYNYLDIKKELERAGESFRTKSDTEVVLLSFDRWGAQGIQRLEGMFAFAIWDEDTKTLTLARDWLGQKSILYAETELGWVFASEVKGILASGLVTPEIDLETLSHSISLRYLPGTSTLFAGISKVPPATMAVVGAERREFTRLWSPAYEPKWTESEEQILDRLDDLLKNVVASHLMSEVPLGAFLSGGIDSSTVVAYAARALQEPLRTFSIGVNDEAQSELPWAREVAERYKTRHYERIVEPDLASLAPRMVAAMDEPVDPFAAGVYTVSQITAEHVTVVLGGDGGDELFAGYDRYVGQQLAEIYAHIPSPLRKALLRPLMELVPERFGYKSLRTKLRWLDRMAEKSGVERYAESAAFLRFPHSMKSDLFTPAIWKKIGGRPSEPLLEQYFRDGAAKEFLDQMLHTDCMTRLAEHQLPIVDRMSMAFSLEARNPFLDRRVAEFAMRIPAEWQMKNRRIKYILRKLGERSLSKELLWRKKQGFGFPLALWFRGELRPVIEQIAKDSRLVEAGIFRGEEIRRLVDEHVGGEINHDFRLWLIFNLEIWYRHFFDKASVEELEEWVGMMRSAGKQKRPKLAAAI